MVVVLFYLINNKKKDFYKGDKKGKFNEGNLGLENKPGHIYAETTEKKPNKNRKREKDVYLENNL